ncbi:hypothetical protein H9P43_000111 [Blastocladiella emersonii ATCC 22665]|nr:hypothetical protein H9P43_000111 [Blastocladiella emersonii ATCC 22665]
MTATMEPAQPPAIAYDEREELFREAAALGNLKTVLHYLQAGVNPNARNKLNGMTPLHWAAQRGHLEIVEALLRHGADPALADAKGRAPHALAKKPDVLAALGAAVPADLAPNEAAAELPIQPNYLREPDLAKTWLAPNELPPGAAPVILKEADRPVPKPETVVVAGPAAAAAAVAAPAPPAPTAAAAEPLELIVVDHTSGDYLGAVLVDRDLPIVGAVELVRQELLAPREAIAGRVFRVREHRGRDAMLPVPTTQFRRYSVGQFWGNGEEFRIETVTAGDLEAKVSLGCS